LNLVLIKHFLFNIYSIVLYMYMGKSGMRSTTTKKLKFDKQMLFSTKLTDYVFLTYCYILRQFGQDRMTISYSCHSNNQMQIKIFMKVFVVF